MENGSLGQCSTDNAAQKFGKLSVNYELNFKKKRKVLLLLYYIQPILSVSKWINFFFKYFEQFSIFLKEF